MKIVAISDTHRNFNIDIPLGDIFVFAGDIEAYGYSSELRKFVKWLDSIKIKIKIVIAGNHDGFIYNCNKDARKMLEGHCIYLENSGCTINKIKFYGSPITPTFNDWFFMADRDEQIKKYWDNIPKDIDVLITHGPPYGILDSVPYSYGEHHLGCEELRKRVYDVQPKLHLFGHIHESYGREMFGKTLCVNCSVLDGQYELKNKPQEIKI